MKSCSAVLLGGVTLANVASAGGLSDPTLSLVRVATGLNRPVFATTPVGETNRLFVVEQRTGAIRIVDLGAQTLRPEPFLKISGLTTGSEQGLLGLAFHPGYATNGYFYLNYTTTGGGAAGHTEIVRFQAVGDPRAATTADPASKTVVLTFPQPEANHNGGWMDFGKDGYLYISTGDGGGGNDQHGTAGNAQNRAVLLGKILRIDVDHGTPYAIPEGNPFKDATDMKPEIWAFGLRNPWRCSFDRSTGDLWIGDVGQSSREEIDVIPAGAAGLNFGWRPREGAAQNSAYPSEAPVTAATAPVHDYRRTLGVSVTGGYVYRGQSIPELQGAYVFADYGSGRFWILRPDGTNTTVLDYTSHLNPGPASSRPVQGVSSFGEDASGELYVCDLTDGELYKVVSPKAGITLVNPRISDGRLQFAFNATSGQSYVVESRNSIPGGAWLPLTNLTASAAATNVVVTDAAASEQKFYRVRTP